MYALDVKDVIEGRLTTMHRETGLSFAPVRPYG